MKDTEMVMKESCRKAINERHRKTPDGAGRMAAVENHGHREIEGKKFTQNCRIVHEILRKKRCKS